VGALLALVAIWGASVPLTKLALRDLPPLTLTALRYVIAAPAFMVLLRGRPCPSGRALAAMGALGLLGIPVGQVAQALGVARTSASVATVISATIPIFVVVFAVLRLRQSIRPRQALGLALALGGVALVATGGPGGPATALRTQPAVGHALMLVSALSIALYYVLGAELAGRHAAGPVAAWTSLFGAGAMVPLAAWELRDAAVRVTVQGVGVALYLALLVTVAGMWIWLHALRELPARVPAALQYLQPLVGVALSTALFGDPLGASFWLGTTAVLLGIAASTLPGPGARRTWATEQVERAGDRVGRAGRPEDAGPSGAG
jgi:drug/metabolite transporter (DMT)-like permease